MTVIVFVWTKTKTGHASLKIEGHSDLDKEDKRNTYVSFYPNPRGGTQPSVIEGAFTGLRSTSITMLQDSNAFKNNPDFASAPISGLDENAMIKYWQDARGSGTQWSLLRSNCADMVFKILEAGGAAKKSLSAGMIIARGKIGIVRPKDCIELAKALEGSKI
jgi:hypothetical protein